MTAGMRGIHPASGKSGQKSAGPIFPLFSHLRLFQNFSFGTATLDLREKAGL
jgi:hypothetical protein